MTAKDMFEQLGYVQKIYNDKNKPYSNGIQYMKRAAESEMDRIGMIATNYIEFYYAHKEIVIYTTYEHRNGTTSKSDSGVLSFDEFNTVQKQVEELGWTK